MAAIYADSSDGWVRSFNQPSWYNARTGAGGLSFSSTSSSAFAGISAYRTSARGGGFAYHVFRSFLSFDTSGISTDVSSATLKIFGSSQAGGDLIAVKSNSDIESLGTADFDAIEGWSVGIGSTDGSGGGDNETKVTKYSSEVTTWSTSGYNDITLNAQALADMRDDSKIYIALINYDFDLKDVAPTNFLFNRNGLFFTEYTGTSRDPYIDYELAAAATTDNSVFFGTNF
tara:strand:+ start:1292 stop:1981 length:690 start_codon:yes stop_codon:yes gene_type:complete